MSSNVPARTLVLSGVSGPAFHGRESVDALIIRDGAAGTIGTPAPAILPGSGQPYGIAGAIANLMYATPDQPWASCTCGGTCAPGDFL